MTAPGPIATMHPMPSEPSDTERPEIRPPRVVVVGAGFGGLACVRELSQLVIHVPVGGDGDDRSTQREHVHAPNREEHHGHEQDHGHGQEHGHGKDHGDGKDHGHEQDHAHAHHHAASPPGVVDVHPQITLIDQRNFHTFLPLLYQVATAGLNSADVAYPVRGIVRSLPHTEFRQATVTGVDWDRCVVRLVAPATSTSPETPPPSATPAPPATPGRRGDRGEEADVELPFDHLVIAAGSRVHWFGVPGAAEHAYPLYTLGDAVRLRNHVLSRFEAAAADPGLVGAGALDVVVVGGGPTGVETAGALSELFRGVLRRDFPTLAVDRARVVLVERAPGLLMPFAVSSRRHALDTLRARGVEVRLGVGVTAIEAGSVALDDGTRLATQTVVWAAGVQGGALAEHLGVPLGHGGRIVVGPELAIASRPGGWAIGDIADIDDEGTPLPQLAQVAIQGGVHVARSIAETVAGQEPSPFVYRNKGIMATVGRRAAVAEIPHLPALRGALAWVAWLVLHLVTLLGMRNRLSVLVNWAWNYLTWDRGPRLIFEQPAARDARMPHRDTGQLHQAEGPGGVDESGLTPAPDEP